MDIAQYASHIIIVASSWMAGIFLARYLMRKFFKINPDGPEMVGNGITTDDLLDFDKADAPYIPVKVSKEHGLYYAWFVVNNKFIGQAEKMEEIEMMAYRHLIKTVGLRFEFKHEKEPDEKVA